MTPLHQAVEWVNMEMAQLLVDRGANLEAVNKVSERAV